MFRLRTRRGFCSGSAAASIALSVGSGRAEERSAQTDSDWEVFKGRYIRPDGRVIDTGNQGVSHSEGQGYGMFFASTFNDQAVFEQIWSWTRDTLRHRGDALSSWRWVPTQPHITDTNNASDGDLMIAWALRRGGILWQRPDYIDAARAILADLASRCVRKVGSRTVFLPAMKGFDRSKITIINLSYYLMPALGRAASLDPNGPWRALMETGTQLIQASRFGLWGLPPDWLSIDKKSERIAPAPGFPARFSYDAIRIPLYLKWSKRMVPSLTQSLLAVSQNWSMADLPAWVDLNTGERSPYAAPPGFRAVYQFALHGADALPILPSVKDSADYYSSSLTLLARIAAMEMV
ncbi:endoglucanase [Asaia sp. W19]|uniref:glycosyl hydrolase family 8 n=1 Tax=unclassified Asaia TaxID=2685023 RepID=UPI000F8CD7F5|nr:glycosyl hydrolase family 8 [Asaia sp. W19]RUT26051.1 endoglucanase [Asaia sp. W19]